MQTRFGDDVVILMGNAASTPGGFGRVRGGGATPPNKKLTRILAQHFTVILCCEYHTSAACRICGRCLQHPKKMHRNKRTGAVTSVPNLRVSHCNQRDHKFMVDRDGDAAFKIMARFIAAITGKPLGVWSAEGWRDAAESKAFHSGIPKAKACPVLQDALKAYVVEQRRQLRMRLGQPEHLRPKQHRDE